MNDTTRRRFLRQATALLTTAAVSRAAAPPTRSGPPRFPLSLAAYSFRDQFKDPALMTWEKFLDFCVAQGVDGAELTSYYFPKDVSDAALIEVRRQAFLRGVGVSGTSVGNNFALPDGPERDEQVSSTKRWIDRAAVLGAPHIRVFAGNAKGVDEKTARLQVVKALEECGDYAGQKGIFLGVENHGGVVATPDGLLEIIQAVQSPWVGVNLDTGNFHGEDPYADLARCAPWAVNVQVKVEISRAGKGKEPADLARVASLLRQANYQGWVALEYEAADDPFAAVPRHLDALRKALEA